VVKNNFALIWTAIMVSAYYAVMWLVINTIGVKYQCCHKTTDRSSCM